MCISLVNHFQQWRFKLCKDFSKGSNSVYVLGKIESVKKHYTVDFVSKAHMCKTEISSLCGDALSAWLHQCKTHYQDWFFWWLDIGGTPLWVLINFHKKLTLSAPVSQTIAGVILLAHNWQPEDMHSHILFVHLGLCEYDLSVHNATSIWLLLVYLSLYTCKCVYY